MGNGDTRGDSGSWAGQSIGDEDSDIDVREYVGDEVETHGVKNEGPRSANFHETKVETGTKVLATDAAQVNVAARPEDVRMQCLSSGESSCLSGGDHA